MIARLLRRLWCLLIAAALGAAALAIHLFGARFGPWFAAVAAIAAIAALHPASIAFCFLVSRIGGDPVPTGFRLSLWRAILTYDAEVDASIRGVWIANPFLERRPAPTPRAHAPPRRFALLFLHGYFCNRAVWHPFMKDAANRGYRCEAVTLDDGFSSIDGHTETLDRALDRLLDGGTERVVVVAHSMGGLVARACLQAADAARVAHVFTLGTPHHGTHAARYGIATSVAQMRRDSAWLQSLALREGRGHGLPRDAYTTVFSYHDDIVFPQSSAGLDGAACIAIGGCGHVSLLYDRRVRKIVFDGLETLEARHAGTAGAAS